SEAGRVLGLLGGGDAAGGAVDRVIGVVDEVPDPAIDHVSAAAIGVDLRARVERIRREGLDGAVGGTADHDVAPALERARLDPVDIVAVDARLQQRHGGGRDRIGGGVGGPPALPAGAP